LILSSCSKTSLNLRNWVILEKLKPPLRIKQVSAIYVAWKTHRKDTLQSTTRHWLQPRQYISLSPTLFSIINFNIASPSTPRFRQNGAFLISAMRAKRPVHRIRPSLKSCHIHNMLSGYVTSLKPFATQSWQTIPNRRSTLVVNTF